MGSRKKLWTGKIKFESLLEPFLSNKNGKLIPFIITLVLQSGGDNAQ